MGFIAGQLANGVCSYWQSRFYFCCTVVDLLRPADSAYVAIALFCVGGFAHQMISALLNTLSADVFDAHEVATANGFTGTAAWTSGLLFSLVVGALATTIGYGPLFACLAVFDLIGAVVVIALVRRPRPRLAT
jgi:MFS transporter, ACS family, hexuronate transporter